MRELKLRLRFQELLKRKNIRISVKTYFVDALGAMAFGLFCSLLIGTILGTLGDKTSISELNVISEYCKHATGGALGVSVSYALGAPQLVLFSSVAVGLAGYAFGGPAGAFAASVLSVELGKLVSKETKLDILVTPGVTIISGIITAAALGPVTAALMRGLGEFIIFSTQMQPLLMGMLVSVSVGAALTLPISSAAICMMLGISGLAGGAATAGCCAQMAGFAVMSFRENGWGGVAAQGLGTSMLQMGNIIKNPRIWIPPMLASMITGPVSILVFRLENVAEASGMGTCGLVGPLGILAAMPEGGGRMWIGILLICFLLPGVLTWVFAAVLRRWGWIGDGDLKLEL